MSEKQSSLQPGLGPPPIDHHAINFLESVRASTVLLLGPNPSHHRSPADLSFGLHTLKSLADTMCKLAESNRLCSEKEKISAYTEQIKAETEKIKAQKV